MRVALFDDCLFSLHRSREERGVAEDIENVLAGRHKDGLTLTDLNAVDVGITPQADYDDERVAVEIDLLGHLYHDTVHHEIGAVDEL